MKFNLIETKEILDFEQELGCELVVNERIDHNGSDKYYVKFENGKVMDSGCLIGSFSNGATIDEAIIDYCTEIENTRIAFNAGTHDRKEVLIPKLRHTKLLGK